MEVCIVRDFAIGKVGREVLAGVAHDTKCGGVLPLLCKSIYEKARL